MLAPWGLVQISKDSVWNVKQREIQEEMEGIREK